MQAEIKEDRNETEQERQKRLDDSFNELKTRLEQRKANDKLKHKIGIESHALKIVNDVIEEYVNFLENKDNSRLSFATIKNFSKVRQNPNIPFGFGWDVILGEHHIPINNFHDTLKSLFVDRGYTDINIIYTNPELSTSATVPFAFQFPEPEWLK